MSEVKVYRSPGQQADALRIGRAQFEQVLDHCSSALPREACGVLGGTDRKVERVYCLKNVAPEPDRYLADPIEQLEVFRDIEKRGLALVAVFHSHPTGAAYPSETDVNQAYYPDTLQLIIGFRSQRGPAGRVFKIAGGEVREVDLKIE